MCSPTRAEPVEASFIAMKDRAVWLDYGLAVHEAESAERWAEHAMTFCEAMFPGAFITLDRINLQTGDYGVRVN